LVVYPLVYLFILVGERAVMNSYRLDANTIAQVLDRARRQLPEPVQFPEDFFQYPAKPASVLIPLFQEAGEWHILFIRRSEHEDDRHSGQVAFPGGKVDAGDADALAAALREAEEEIGLSPDHVSVLGYLRDYRTISNYLVTPVVAEIKWPVPLEIDPREVSRVFSIPLRWLSDTDNFNIGLRQLEGWDSQIEVIHYQHYEGELLWGITAKLTLCLLHLLGVISHSGLTSSESPTQE
jgi:8-oxo-dGTP pyrophosphatase MutT (NUDIX family)